MQMFADEGYDAVTLRALAEKLELQPRAAVPLLRRQARDLRRGVRARLRALRRRARARGARRRRIPRSACASLGRAYFQFALREPHAYRIMFELREPASADFPQYSVKEIRSWQALLQAVELAVQAGVLAGEPD